MTKITITVKVCPLRIKDKCSKLHMSFENKINAVLSSGMISGIRIGLLFSHSTYVTCCMSWVCGSEGSGTVWESCIG
jgi:hypothetical protein